MITNATRIVSPNLYAPNASLNLNYAEDSSSQGIPLAAVTYIAEKRHTNDELSALADLCRQHVEASIYAYISEHRSNVLMFVSDGPWQPKSALVRRKKLWNQRSWALDDTRYFPSLTEEIAIERDFGVRYAGFARVSRQGFATAVQIARKDPACAILIRDCIHSENAESVLAFFSAAFPTVKGVETTSINWTSLCHFACSVGDIILRVSGLFDDSSAAIDLIFDPTRHTAASF